MSIEEYFQKWVRSGEPTELRLLQRSITEDRGFTRELAWQSRAEQLLVDDRWDEVIRLVESHMPGAFLSPVAHRLLAMAREEIRDDSRADTEWALVELSLTAIDGSGRGTQEMPWRVLHVADEYALLDWRQLVPQAQRCLPSDEGMIDVITCTDGSERWFQLI